MSAGQNLAEFLQAHPRVVVITGAGCSTDSGIGDYRDANGQWKHSAPIQYPDFMAQHSVRQRYWARSMLGWPQFAQAEPNQAHLALVNLEQQGRLVGLITQNVDRLHQRAGHQAVLDLHGRLDRVRCQACGATSGRQMLQEWLETANSQHIAGLRRELAANNARSAATRSGGAQAPDGDAVVTRIHARFEVPDCSTCGDILKPDVVFYGESVPKPWVQHAYDWVAEADGVLVVGSSLMVFSSFRFCRAAASAGTPIAILNQGVTRADGLAALKLDAPCGATLQRAAAVVGGC